MAEFTYLPDSTADLEQKPSVGVIQYGDGYESRQEEGLNPDKRVWSLSFTNRDESEKDDIVGFLRARRALESFDWVDPEGVTGKYVCRAWSPKRVRHNLWNVNCVFHQVFEP